mmetsp:Transcript_87970/g.257154  ORF Transcript_87970/g.257154 Transcript_87970/m.257154 type:complete len:219 (+) Transcript_87970:731-1387(+)
MKPNVNCVMRMPADTMQKPINIIDHRRESALMLKVRTSTLRALNMFMNFSTLMKRTTLTARRIRSIRAKPKELPGACTLDRLESTKLSTQQTMITTPSHTLNQSRKKSHFTIAMRTSISRRYTALKTFSRTPKTSSATSQSPSSLRNPNMYATGKLCHWTSAKSVMTLRVMTTPITKSRYAVSMKILFRARRSSRCICILDPSASSKSVLDSNVILLC